MITREQLENHAVAILLAFSGAMFGIGLALQYTGRAIEKAVTFGGPR